MLRDPDIEMAIRYINVIDGLTEDPFCRNSRISHENLKWMCEKIVGNCGVWPHDKTGRWLGFVQGVLASQGAIDVDNERNYSRGLYHMKYIENGNTIPETSFRE